MQEEGKQTLAVSAAGVIRISSGHTVDDDQGGQGMKIKIIICPRCGYEHVDRNMCIVCGCGWRSCA